MGWFEATQMPKAFIHSHSTAQPHPHVWEVPGSMGGSTSSIWSDIKRENRMLRRIGNAASPVGLVGEEIVWIELNLREGQDSSTESWC